MGIQESQLVGCAIVASDKSVVEQTIGDKSVVEEREWFRAVARELLGEDKPGTALHYITDKVFDERSCQRYAAGTVTIPVAFLRKLFASKQGEPFYDAFMALCDADWFRERERARRVGEAALRAAEQK